LDYRRVRIVRKFLQEPGRIIQVEAAAIDPQYHPASTAPQTSLNPTQHSLSASSVVEESAMSTTKTAVRADPAVSEWITVNSDINAFWDKNLPRSTPQLLLLVHAV
jgi:hypothetical protein